MTEDRSPLRKKPDGILQSPSDLKNRDMRTHPSSPALACLLLFMTVLAGPVHAADSYGYPITNRYAATIIGTPTQLQAPRMPFRDVNYKRVNLTLLQNQPMPDLLWFNSILRNGLLYQRDRAPLIFIVAGTGGSYRSTRVRNLATYFYQAGFHVITLSSPTHPNFVAAASSSHYPGALQQDSQDLHRVMQLLREKLQDQIEVSDYYLTGYSLGGTQAAFLAKLDEQYKAFNFRKVLLINPAVNLYNSVRILDGMLIRNAPTMADIDDLVKRLIDALVETYRQRGDVITLGENFQAEDALYLAYQDIEPPKDKLEALIGVSFRISVANMVFVADVINNAGYIKPKNLILYPTDSLTDYFKVALGVSFMDYFRDLYLPYHLARQRGSSESDIIRQAGLSSIEDYLKRATHIGVVTNQDEIILAPGELNYLRQVFGSRLRIYPHGGHLGNMEYTQNVAHMLEFFKN